MPMPRYRSIETWPLLSAGFRPFFLAAGLTACLSMALWLAMLRGAVALPTGFSPVAWHFHELLFGFVTATIAGFLLTAIPNWTRRLPLQGWPLGILVLLWCLGRAAVAFSNLTGPLMAMLADLSFLVAFTLVVGREILAGRNWRNLPVLAALSLLIVANALIHAGIFYGADWGQAGKRLAISIVILLISLIGGRIIPSFTTNYLKKRRPADKLPAPFGLFDSAALAVSAAALIIWIVSAEQPASGVFLVVAAATQAIRLGRWRGGATLQEPLLWILHLGYAWVPVGLALLGAAAWMPNLTPIAIHALTSGAIGTMTLAVMTRASLGHSGRALTAGRGTLAIYLLVLVSAVARVIAPFLDAGYTTMLDLAGGAWMAAFALFSILYWPLYVRR